MVFIKSPEDRVANQVGKLLEIWGQRVKFVEGKNLSRDVMPQSSSSEATTVSKEKDSCSLEITFYSRRYPALEVGNHTSRPLTTHPIFPPKPQKSTVIKGFSTLPSVQVLSALRGYQLPSGD